MALEIVIIFLLVVMNGIFAMSEIAVVSARKVRLQQQAAAGRRGAQTALDLANSPDRFLSTVQIGITLIGILAGTFGGATVAEELAAGLSAISWLAPYSEAIAVVIVVVTITYLSLVVGELAPKRFALTDAERVAAVLAPPMQALSKVTAPIVWVLSVSTKLVLRLMGARPSADEVVTEEDIKLMIEEGTESGVFVPAEQELVEEVFRLADRTAGALMTPRPEIVWLDLDDHPDEIHRTIAQSGYSQFPVAEADLDNVLGMVHPKDLLNQTLQGTDPDVRAVLRPVIFVPESMAAFQVLERFKETHSDVVLVIDEYGGVQGLLTATDILEALIGDIPTPDEPDEPEIVQREDGSWLVDGRILVDELEDLLPLQELPFEGEGHYQTLGGMVMACLGRIPTAGEYCVYGGLRFEVVDMDGRRVDKVLVSTSDDSDQLSQEQAG